VLLVVESQHVEQMMVRLVRMTCAVQSVRLWKMVHLVRTVYPARTTRA
jgi:hypothetical protein